MPMKLVRRRALKGTDIAGQIRRRIREIDDAVDRLANEKGVLEARLVELERGGVSSSSSTGVHCPRCGRDRDFLTDADGYLAHVLEDASDTDLLVEGKPLYCPGCGDVFLWENETA